VSYAPVLTDGLEESDSLDLPKSSVNAARLFLEENDIEPTEARINALARLAETAATDIEIEEEAA
jgi:hypothetical protein